MDKALNFALAFWDELLNRVGKYVQIVEVGEDLLNQGMRKYCSYV
ncbi:MAG: hypothetical protein QXR45_15735 [Candidatus Bathyarchaeia archaeon]